MLLFDNVENSAELHSKVMSGEDLGCVLIKPSLILDPLQVNIAVFKAKHRYALVTTSIIFCSLFIMKDHCSKVCLKRNTQSRVVSVVLEGVVGYLRR